MIPICYFVGSRILFRIPNRSDTLIEVSKKNVFVCFYLFWLRDTTFKGKRDY